MVRMTTAAPALPEVSAEARALFAKEAVEGVSAAAHLRGGMQQRRACMLRHADVVPGQRRRRPQMQRKIEKKLHGADWKLKLEKVRAHGNAAGCS